MKSPRPSRSKSLPMMTAVLSCAAVVQAAPQTLEMPREKQLQSTWCWAAVSTMAVNSFPMKLPGGAPITQRTTVILKTARIKDESEYTDAAFNAASGACNTPGSCGGVHDPFLYNAVATALPPGKVLTRKLFNFEIVKRRRPVIVTWDYGQGNGNADTPAGMHLLIITGYNPSNGKVRLFDPWPVDNGGVDDPHRRKRERWIPYALYLDPVMDMGQPVTAVHEQDLYQLRRFDEILPGKPKYPEPGTFAQHHAMSQPGTRVAGGRLIRAETFAAEDARAASAEPHRLAAKPKRDLGLQRVDFAEALAATRPKIDAHMKWLVVTLADGSRVRGRKRLQAAPAFPLVTLETAQILTSRDKQEALFERRTSVLLVPVIDTRTDEVIDSFLIYNQAGEWKIGGYANTEIAGVLVQQRKSFTSERRHPGDFFVVSVPEQATFYFAHGAPGSVQLVSVDNRGRDLEGKDAQFKGANATLDGLARSIDESAKKAR
jgi:hypothetical protein